MSLFDDTRRELGNPHVYQVSREQFEQMETERLGQAYQIGASWGISSKYYPHLWVAPGMTQKRRLNCYIHELLHLLYPWQKHWWITLASRRLAGGGHGDDGTQLYGHDISEIPPRDVVLRLVRRQAQRFNGRHDKEHG